MNFIKANCAMLLVVATVIATAAILLMMGREPICKCGYVKLWHGVVFSSENSQHMSDWYTPSHIIHGFIFFGVLSLFFRRMSFSWKLFISMLIECAWEIGENTDAVIQRYREVTISLDYYGDSVLNSVMDIGAMVLGFWLASKLPIWVTVALAVIFEIGTMIIIRDGLALNVIMLIYPIDAIADWQALR